MDQTTPLRVLIVEDDPGDAKLLQMFLARAETPAFETQVAANVTDALACIAENTFDAVFLDLNLPDSRGLDTVVRVRQAALFLPIVVLTGANDEEQAMRAVKEGAQDYLFKGDVDTPLILRAVRYAIERAQVGRALSHAHAELKDAYQTINRYNKHLEEMLEERTRDLIRTERQAAFALLIQGIIHNLRNPLAAILACSQLITNSADELRTALGEIDVIAPGTLDDRVKEFLEDGKMIGAAAEQMNGMISSMMAKSRSDKGEQMEVVDLNHILRQELEFLQSDMTFKHQVEKSIELGQERIPVRVVPSELSQVFQNLVKNAMDAMWQQEQPALAVASGTRDETAWFRVSDNGPGIPDEILPKLFDPFFTTKPKAGTDAGETPTGTGLGLHMCSEIARSYDGRIDVQSAVGRGTSFTVEFPLLQSPETADSSSGLTP